MTEKKKILVIQKVHDKGMELIKNHPNFIVDVTDDVSEENLKKKIVDCDGVSVRIAKLSGATATILCSARSDLQQGELFSRDT